jgi:RimJ/RimL family protein N-acetyltransferase
MNFTNLIILSERLKITAISKEYAESIYKEFSEEIATFMFPKPAEHISEIINFIDTSIKNMLQGKELVFAILDKANEEFLGCCGIHNMHSQTPEIGIWLRKSAHGKRIGLEAVKALKNWADHNLQYKYLVYPVDKRNIASRKIPEALGGQIAKEYKKKSMSGKILDEIEYRISK